MKKYQVEMIQKETFIVNVEAEDEQEATDKASILFSNGDYEEMGDCTVEVGEVFENNNEVCPECEEGEMIYRMFEVEGTHDLVEKLQCDKCNFTK